MDVCEKFKFFTLNEWVFDSASIHKFNNFIPAQEKDSFEINLQKIDWPKYSMNLGYGIKNYVLREEASLPSIGYSDVVQTMKDLGVREFLPWHKQGIISNVRAAGELRKIILNRPSVKEAMAQMVKERLEYNRGTLHIEVPEDKVYREIEATAIKSLNTIASNYNHRALQWMAQAMKLIFTTVYKQIVVNEEALKRVRKICAQRTGPVIFCPTHRSYVDFLLVSAVMYYYNMEVPHICAGEDLMMISGVSHLLRMSGAFFMRRTFRGDPLYKAIFTSYVELLC